MHIHFHMFVCNITAIYIHSYNHFCIHKGIYNYIYSNTYFYIYNYIIVTCILLFILMCLFIPIVNLFTSSLCMRSHIRSTNNNSIFSKTNFCNIWTSIVIFQCFQFIIKCTLIFVPVLIESLFLFPFLGICVGFDTYVYIHTYSLCSVWVCLYLSSYLHWHLHFQVFCY